MNYSLKFRALLAIVVFVGLLPFIPAWAGDSPKTVAATANQFAGSWTGNWSSAGKSGDAKWDITHNGGSKLTIQAVIETPGGEFAYALAPRHQSGGYLNVTDPNIKGKIYMLEDGRIYFAYKRQGRDGHYIMRRGG